MNEQVRSEPHVVVITGMSGAGRSHASNVLEDLGYFVVDNLPADLIVDVVRRSRLSTVVSRLNASRDAPDTPAASGGGPGRGRALGAGEVKFSGQVTPRARKVTYRIDMKRVIQRKLNMGIADGVVLVDGREIYQASGLRVGLFTSTEDF